MIIASSCVLQACLLSYSIHHKRSGNFTIKLCGLSHLPSCDATWAEPGRYASHDKPHKNQVLLSFKGSLYSKHKLR